MYFQYIDLEEVRCCYLDTAEDLCDPYGVVYLHGCIQRYLYLTPSGSFVPDTSSYIYLTPMGSVAADVSCYKYMPPSGSAAIDVLSAINI